MVVVTGGQGIQRGATISKILTTTSSLHAYLRVHALRTHIASLVKGKLYAWEGECVNMCGLAFT